MARDPNRIGPVLKTLERVWRANPDLRLGQLLIATVKDRKTLEETARVVFNREDDEWLAKLAELQG